MCVHQQRARARARVFRIGAAAPTHTHTHPVRLWSILQACNVHSCCCCPTATKRKKRNCWMNKWHLIRLYINSYTCNTPKHNWREHRECTQPSARPFPVFLPIHARFDMVFPWLYPRNGCTLFLCVRAPLPAHYHWHWRQARCEISTGFYTSTQTRWYFLIHQTQLTSRWMKHDFPLSLSSIAYHCLARSFQALDTDLNIFEGKQKRFLQTKHT